MPKMTRCILAAAALMLSVPAVLAEDEAKKEASPASEKKAEEAKVYTVNVSGMTWPAGWAPKVKKALEALEGVEKVVINGTKSATITMKAGKTLTSEQVTKAIEGAGFKASDFMEKKAEEKKEEKKADDKNAAEMKPSSAK